MFVYIVIVPHYARILLVLATRSVNCHGQSIDRNKNTPPSLVMAPPLNAEFYRTLQDWPAFL